MDRKAHQRPSTNLVPVGIRLQADEAQVDRKAHQRPPTNLVPVGIRYLVFGLSRPKS